MNTSQISENSHTQPYSQNRCWMKIKNAPHSPLGNERFCSKVAREYWCSKGMNMRVRMFLCEDHVKKMEHYGYSVRLVTEK